VAKPLEPAGFWLSGLVCVVVAVLKLAAGAQWSWWRVSLPLCAVLGHNILYIIVGFVWLTLADDAAARRSNHDPSRGWWLRSPNRGAGVVCRVRG
jgi:hypothetical protein